MTRDNDSTVAPRAIETIYQGYRFRSRLEARWAVFFEVLGVSWEYEKEGYDLGSVGLYLPDFWLPVLQMWAEVKPEPFSETERAKTRALAMATGKTVLRLVGVPTYKVYWADCPDRTQGSRDEDYLLDDQYVHTEKRWYCSPGLDDDEDASASFWMSERTQAAYAAARGARFEHGERPATRVRIAASICKEGFERHRKGRRIPPDAWMCADCGEIEYDIAGNFEP